MNDIRSTKLSPNYNIVDTAEIVDRYSLPTQWTMNQYAVANLIGNPKYNGFAELILKEDPRYSTLNPGFPVLRVTFEGVKTLNLFWRTVELVKLVAFVIFTSPVYLYSDSTESGENELLSDYKVRWSRVATGLDIHIYEIDVWGARGMSYCDYEGNALKNYASLEDVVENKKIVVENEKFLKYVPENKLYNKIGKLAIVFHFMMDLRNAKDPRYNPNLRYQLPKTGW